ncbi:MAG: potassium-transporting ATPase subunit KdpC [Desulfobacterales bacterium]|nr:potassium-transporting ATPase subunit KdpC [Desulfobacterales bacterium]
MLNTITNAIRLFIVFTILTGIIYPLAVTGLAQVFFPAQANGNIIMKNGKSLGSSLIGQPFTDPTYFWSRPSATQPFAYNAASSTGSNQSQSNSHLLQSVKKRIAELKQADPSNTNPIPVDLVTASGSGLDPHISLASAFYQMARVARERQVDESKIYELIEANTDKRQFGILGEPAVNVLKLNLAIDELGRK